MQTVFRWNFIEEIIKGLHLKNLGGEHKWIYEMGQSEEVRGKFIKSICTSKSHELYDQVMAQKDEK